MKNNKLLKEDGMHILSKKLSLIEAERFITLIIRDPFDYTEWQKDLYSDMTADELFQKAAKTWEERIQPL